MDSKLPLPTDEKPSTTTNVRVKNRHQRRALMAQVRKLRKKGFKVEVKRK